MKKHEYTVKPTNKQIEIMQEHWLKMQKEYNKFHDMVRIIEKEMERKTGIKGIEFFMCDNDYVGIGNADRKMKVIQIDYNGEVFDEMED